MTLARSGNRSPSKWREPNTTETIVRPFSYQRPESLADAVARLSAPGSLPLGGGTDLLVCIEEGLAFPDTLIDLRAIPGSSAVQWREDGSARIGAGTRISRLAADADVRARFGVLAEACQSVGSEALRHMGTIGGNLCQRPRCWYFRRNVPCLKNGGDSCPARDGENQYHAILGGGPCWIVHPSDPAVALVALDATVEIAGSAGTRTVAIARFFVAPKDRLDHETILAAGEIVTAIEIPAHAAGGKQSYRKVMQRSGWDFALVSLAAVRRRNGDVKLVLGGVAPFPWRVDSSVEEDTSSGNLDEADIATLADRALYDTAPLAKNQYKVEIAGALLREAIAELSRN